MFIEKKLFDFLGLRHGLIFLLGPCILKKRIFRVTHVINMSIKKKHEPISHETAVISN